ncbi:MAG: hypothetical protein ACI921_000985, partial [Polaribacter sp.]
SKIFAYFLMYFKTLGYFQAREIVVNFQISTF